MEFDYSLLDTLEGKIPCLSGNWDCDINGDDSGALLQKMTFSGAPEPKDLIKQAVAAVGVVSTVGTKRVWVSHVYLKAERGNNHLTIALRYTPLS